MNNSKDDIVAALRNGGAVVFPTDTVYGLAAMPSDAGAVDKVYQLKQRPRNMNLPIMVASIKDLEGLGVDINTKARKLLNSYLVPGAITFVLGFKDDTRISWLEGRDEIAVRIPDSELVLSVLRETGPLLVTSANLHGMAKTPNSVKEILSELNGTPDLAVEGEAGKEVPSTIINCRFDPPKIERNGLISTETINRILENE